MKLYFDYDIEKKKIVFHGAFFKVLAKAETYEEIADFAKDVIENYIAIPGLKRKEKRERD